MADEVIGRADYVLGIDNAGVKRGVAESEQIITASGAKTEAAAESSAYRAGVAIGNGIKSGAKIVARSAAALFAVATKGALDLANVQADYTAETGATADEAVRAGKAINAMAGRNIQPLQEIGKTLAKVHTDLGLAGDEAERTTEGFLRFARATKQDAAASVMAFDDILDAWNLTAQDSQALMDKLIVSHQKFGGSIEADQAALAKLAPAMRALNLTTDDAIALMNLFKASGLEVADAAIAFSKALATVKSPEELNRLIDDISRTEDPLLRAQKAADLFGQKAGPKLANALAGNHLADFKISIDESRGATEKAADALDNTFGARAQLMVNKFASVLRGLGNDWGPLLTGAASAGTLLTSIFGDQALRALGPKVVEAFKALGSKAGTALGDGFEAIWTGAGGTVTGNFIASRIEAIVDSTKNSRIADGIKAGAAKAGALWGLVFAGAQGVASTLYDTLATAIKGSAVAGAVRSAVLASAIELGTLQGTTFAGAAAKAALAVAIVLPVTLALAYFNGQLPFQDPKLKDALDKGMDELHRRLKVGAYAAGDDAGTTVVEAAGDAMVREWKAQQALRPAGDAMVETWKAQQSKLAAAITLTVKGAFGSDLAARSDYARAWARRQGNIVGAAVAQGIEERRQTVDQAWQDLLDGIKNSQSATARTARDIGRLISKRLQDGLHDADPAVRAKARYTKQVILDELEQLKPRVGTLTKEAMQRLRKLMDNADPDIRAAARRIYAAVNAPISPLVSRAVVWGKAIGHGIANGIWATIGAIAGAAAQAALTIAKYLSTRSPSELGPLSHGGGPEGMGRRIISGVTRGVAGGIPELNATLNRRLSIRGFSLAGMNPTVLGDLAGGRAAHASSLTSVRHGDISIGAIHLHGVGSDVSAPAAKRFATAVGDEVAQLFRRQGARRGIHPSVP